MEKLSEKQAAGSMKRRRIEAGRIVVLATGNRKLWRRMMDECTDVMLSRMAGEGHSADAVVERLIDNVCLVEGIEQVNMAVWLTLWDACFRMEVEK